MLNPDDRALYTDALRPPPGYRFESAVAATYSLDLETLLTIPLHLALFSAERPLDELLRDGVALLEALRRTTDHITVYAQAGRILAPSHPHVLYGLLEKCVVEVMPAAPTGSFHPKLWLILFENPDDASTLLRLLVLTRNITGDRCWDLGLTLDGTPAKRNRKQNRPLYELVRRLPDLAVRKSSSHRREHTNALADLARLTEWELPEGFEELHFHEFGLSPGKWAPVDSNRLAVISPFISPAALEQLAESSYEPLVLISRPEELGAIDAEILDKFTELMVIAEQAELEDGEEPANNSDPALPTYGLHAKAYIAETQWHTHLYVGSANASNPALVNGTNVELLAELVGRTRKVGGIDDMLDADGFGGVLTLYSPPEEPETTDPAEEDARRALENARRDLAISGLQIRYAETEGGWSPTLEASRPVNMIGVSGVRTWLVTREPETAVDALALSQGTSVVLKPSLVQYSTSFVAFELTAEGPSESVRFVLGLDAPGLPVNERDAAIVRDVIRNQDGFLRYVILLLAEAGEEDGVFGKAGLKWGGSDNGRPLDEGFPIFEHLTRAFCRYPERLDSIERLLNDLRVPGEDDVVPPGFNELWRIFRAAVAAGVGDKP
jgi:hypothetical protein